MKLFTSAILGIAYVWACMVIVTFTAQLVAAKHPSAATVSLATAAGA